MKNIDLGQTIGILANVGVIAGIAFLAFELRQNNELLNPQATAASTQIRLGSQQHIIGDHNVAGMLAKLQRGESLTDEESIVIGFFYSSTITGMQYSHQEFASGRVQDEPVGSRTWHLAFCGEFAWPGLRQYWEARRGMYNPEFEEWMDENVVYEEASPESDWRDALNDNR